MSGAPAPTETSKRSHARETRLHGRTLEAFAGWMAGRRAGKEAASTPFVLVAPEGAAAARCAKTRRSTMSATLPMTAPDPAAATSDARALGRRLLLGRILWLAVAAFSV